MNGTDDRHYVLLPEATLIFSDIFTMRDSAIKKNMSLAAAPYLVIRKIERHLSTVMKMTSQNGK
jgi:hypothetical protein